MATLCSIGKKRFLLVPGTRRLKKSCLIRGRKGAQEAPRPVRQIFPQTPEACEEKKWGQLALNRDSSFEKGKRGNR